MDPLDIVLFIANHLPQFSKRSGEKYRMFTVLTQSIEADTVTELLERGINMMKHGAEVLKYPTLSELLKQVIEKYGKIEYVPDESYFQYRLFDTGTTPSWCPGKELKMMIKHNELMQKHIDKMLWPEI